MCFINVLFSGETEIVALETERQRESVFLRGILSLGRERLRVSVC